MTIAVNSWIKEMHGYVPGEQLNDPDIIKLNTNEACYPPAPEVVKALQDECAKAQFHKYPDPTCKSLREAIATRLSVEANEIVVGNGSDEILRLLIHAFTRPGQDDQIALTNPTYTLYGTLADMFGAETETFQASPPDYTIPEALIETPAKLIFLPNPNPPIGTYYSAEDLELLAAADSDRLLVIDEAYVDFAPEDALSVYKKFENVVLTRTFSKSYALAGLRVGFVVCRPELAAELNKIRDSYNVNRLTQVAALAAWNSPDYYAKQIVQLREDRNFLANALSDRGFEVPKSEGNFVFARKASAKKLYEFLKTKKILVRYFDLPELRDGVRITIGTRDQLERLLSAIDEFH